MEKLLVNNFLVIKKANFDVGRINLIIGSQANGKSILAKLLYFFREFLNSTYLESIMSFDLKKDVEKKALLEFKQYFPKYAWINQNFNIEYIINDISITINKNKSSNDIVKFNYSSNLISLHRMLKNSYKKKQHESGDTKIHFIPDAYFQVIEEHVFEEKIGNNFNRSLFIPAGRSFFANLQKNIFSFLSSNIDIDPFISQFGSKYEFAKGAYDKKYDELFNDKMAIKFYAIVESIIVGRYKHKNGKDWIEYKDQKVNLADASSGQQEALPMLLVMSIHFLARSGITMFIEEPEAHLFPVSQKHIISLIGLIYNNAKQDFVITTHSPYILTAINNMILARDVANEQGNEAIKDIVDPEFTIDYEDVKAYTIENGVLISILDDESRLIGTNIIDSVSDEFSDEFDSLINLQMEIN